MPSPRNSTSPGTRMRPASRDAASAAHSSAPATRMSCPSGMRDGRFSRTAASARVAALIRFVAEDSGAAFHDLAAGRATLSPGQITPPSYRGKRLLPVISWLCTTHLTGVPVEWRLERRLGPDYLHRELEPLGWSLSVDRDGRWLLMRGAVPPPHELPPPRSFEAGGLTFEADYGV